MTTQNSRKTSVSSRLLTTTALTAASLMVMAAPVLADDPSHSWVLDTEAGSFSTDISAPNVTNIKLDTSRAVGVGNATIYKGHTVNVDGKLFAVRDNRVDPTLILGHLNSNGKIVIIDGNGVFFGPDSQVDVAGLVATTGDISTDSLMNDDVLTIGNFGAGGIDISSGAQITVEDAGIAAFVSPTIRNAGVINARLGKVAFAAGEKVTLDLYGDKLVEIAVTDKLADAIIEHTGTINAEGGTVQMTAQAAKEAVDNIINVKGVVTVASATQQGGKIVLSGGEQGAVRVSGKLDASGTQGGGTIQATGQSVDIASGAELKADGVDNGNGGSVYIIGDSLAVLSGSVSAKGGANGGNGGFVELSSNDQFGITGTVDTTAANGDRGTFLIDPRDLELRIGTRPGVDFNLYESDIEALSYLTDIDLQARRNFTVSSGVYGVSDGVITLADNSNLTIQTANEPYQLKIGKFIITDEPNNSGVIDLTGNSTYGANLEFKTSGTGSINILGATANNQSSDITLSKLTTENGAITVNTNKGAITWNGNVTTQGGSVTGTATGQNYVGATIATNGGNVTLSGSGANFWDTGILLAHNGVIDTDGGDINLTANNTKLVINGQALAGTGDLFLKAPAMGRIEFWGAGVLQGDAVDLQSGLGITQGTLGSIIAHTLTGDANQSVELSGQNQIDTLGNFETGSVGNIGGFILHDLDGFDVASAVSTQGGAIDLTTDSTVFSQSVDILAAGSLVSNGGNISIDTNGSAGGFTTVAGSINAGAGDVDINARQFKLNGTSTVTADQLNVTGGLVTQGTNSVVTANLLTGSLASYAQFDGANKITNVGDFATGTAGWSTGGFRLNNASGAKLKVTGAVSSDGGVIAITNNARLDVGATGSVVSGGGNIDLTANGNDFIYIDGSVNSGAGVTTLSASHTVLRNGSTVNAGTLAVYGKDVDQYAGSTITAGLLTGSLTKTANFAGTANDITTLGDFTTGVAGTYAGGFTLVDNNGLAINGNVSTQGGNIDIDTKTTVWSQDLKLNGGKTVSSKGGDINLTNDGPGRVIIAGTLDARGSLGNVTLEALGGGDMQFWNGSTVYADTLTTTAGQIWQQVNSTIFANLLTGSVQKYAEFIGTNNDVVALGNFSTGTVGWYDDSKGFTLVDNNGLDVVGTVSTTGGDVSLTTVGGDLHFTGTSGVTTQGGAFAARSTSLVDVDQGANIDLVDGTAYIDAPQVNLGADIKTTGEITGTAMLVNVENNTAEIQDGIDVAADTLYPAPRPTVNVAAGTYTENVTIDKALKLAGTDATIKASGGNLITVSADHVNIDPFVFDGMGTASYGIYALAGSDGLVVDGNTFYGFTQDAIHVEGSSNIELTGNIIHNVGNDGIEVVGGTGNKITGNYVGYTDAGITAGAANNIGANGIKVSGSAGVAVKGNKTTETAGYGIYVAGSNSAVIGDVGADKNTVTNADLDGIKVSGGDLVTVRGNDVSNIGRVGIYAEHATNLLIDQNTVDHSTFAIGTPYGGITTDWGSDISITGNTVTNSGHGVMMYQVNGKNTVSGNHIDNVTTNGVNANQVAGLTVSGNFIGENAGNIGGNGVYATLSSGAHINGNTISHFGGTSGGIVLGQGDDSEILGNTVTGSNAAGQTAIKVTGSNRVQIGTGGSIGADSNKVSKVGSGIIISGGSDVVVDNNKITDASYGIVASKLAGLDVTDNVLDGKVTNAGQGIVGISASEVSDLVIGGLNDANKVDDFATGIRVASSDDAQVSYNQINKNGNTTNSANGILISGGDSVDVDWNQVEDSSNGIQLSGTTNAKVRRNTISSTDDGIVVTSAANTLDLIDNTINVNDSGIVFTDAVNTGDTVNIFGNKITANEDGDTVGAGIVFKGSVTNASVNIGNGTLGSPSNFITVLQNKFGSDSSLDGIRFEGTVGNGSVLAIDGNRIGFNKFLVEDDVEDDGIEFAAGVNGSASVSITDNNISAEDDAIRFNGNVDGNATITIGGLNDGNILEADGDGVEFAANLGGAAQVEISYNTVTASGDGLKFGTVNNADTTFPYSDRELLIAENTITGGDNGINFTGLVSGFSHDTLITGNSIDGQNGSGIRFGNAIDDAEVRIVSNDDINGDDDGIQFNGQIRNNALVQIADNTRIEGEDDDAIDFVSDIITGSVVEITGNHAIVADDNADNGIEFAGVNAASVLISGNNAGITADNHGIYFGGAIGGGADLDILDNIIYADADNNGSGDGIHFASTIGTSTINIGDGSGHGGLNFDASNIISGEDGIHFAGAVNGNAQIVIDGNRLGYTASKLSGPISNNRLDDNGIVFAGAVSGNADIDITDNIIRADEQGILFGSSISGNANVLIGGSGDGNIIDANQDGIEFNGSISGNSRVTLSYNEVDADYNGIVFRGETSNADNTFPYSESEILISNNDVEGGTNGIAFFQDAYGWRHDIMISDNVNIVGYNGDGILFEDDIEAASLRILNNDSIYGSRDGIHVEGRFSDDALIEISGNDDIDSGFGDGIEVTDTGFTWGADLNITNNHVHYTGDNGIEVNNVDGAYIYNNTVHDTGANGIAVSNSDDAEVRSNDIENADEHGILVDGSEDADVVANDINRSGDDGIHASNSDGISIRWNDVNRSGDDGINLVNSDDAEINFNDIFSTGLSSWNGNGIEVQGNFWNDNTDIIGNTISFAGADGVEVTNSAYSDIRWNDVYFSGDDGIDIDNSAWVDVTGNHVHGAWNNGIEVTDSFGADITWNRVHYTGDDGIYVRGSALSNVNYNNVHNTGRDGIDVEYSWGVDVNGNTVETTGGNGIEVQGSDFADIENNTVNYAGENGIYVNPSSFVDITGNAVNFAAWDGIQVNGGHHNTADGNTVLGSGWNGIAFNGSDNFEIVGNTANNNGEDGILVDGSNFGSITGNVAHLNLNAGIEVRNAANVDVNNNAANNNAVGLRLENVDEVQVIGNGFGFNSGYGVLAAGASNGVIRLLNNVINASPVGARFESGAIDLSILGLPNIIVGTGGTVGLQFDEVGAPGSLSLVGNTIGSTTFSGFLPVGSFYVRFEDGTLLDTVTGDPIVIDGLNANFDGLIPALQGGFLTPAQLAFLESRIYDADDALVNGRGQLFVGVVPTSGSGLENLEDFFNRYGTPGDGVSGFSVTVRGLPNVTAAGLNALSPAAGEAGPAGLNAIAPAAGEETGNVAPQDIEPEAGGEDVSCWSDAVSAGGTTTFNYGGSFEDSLSGAGKCNSGDI